MNRNNTTQKITRRAIVVGIFFSFGFIVTRIIIGQSTSFEDVVISLLHGVIVGMGIYIIGTKQQKK